MNRKFQVFVSSTFNDMQSERQAAVQAILTAGHIPAGMELFAAGDKSQLDTIKRWIDQSDVYMLVLGGRYGSIEPETGNSYIEVEYDYAVEKGKPLFAAVISDAHLERKVKADGPAVMEQDNVPKYRAFKNKVKTKVCRFFEDTKDVKIIALESIPTVTDERDLAGWVRGDEVLDPKPLLEEMKQLRAENIRNTKTIDELRKKVQSERFGFYTFDELWALMAAENVALPRGASEFGKIQNLDVLSLLLTFADQLIVGVHNAVGMSELSELLFFAVLPKLAVYGLAEKVKQQNRIQLFHLSESGKRFLAIARPKYLELVKKRESNQKAEATHMAAAASPMKKPKKKT